jgi:hypothetical protein
MPLSTKLGSRDWVIDRIKITIKNAARQGRRLSVTDEAARWSQHPACRMSLDEVREEILRLAVSERVPMELDSLAERRGGKRN